MYLWTLTNNVVNVIVFTTAYVVNFFFGRLLKSSVTHCVNVSEPLQNEEVDLTSLGALGPLYQDLNTEEGILKVNRLGTNTCFISCTARCQRLPF